MELYLGEKKASQLPAKDNERAGKRAGSMMQLQSLPHTAGQSRLLL